MNKYALIRRQRKQRPPSITPSSQQATISAGFVQVTLSSFSFQLVREATCTSAVAERWSCRCRQHSLRHGSLHIINRKSAAPLHRLIRWSYIFNNWHGCVLRDLAVFTGCLCRQRCFSQSNGCRMEGTSGRVSKACNMGKDLAANQKKMGSEEEAPRTETVLCIRLVCRCSLVPRLLRNTKMQNSLQSCWLAQFKIFFFFFGTQTFFNSA